MIIAHQGDKTILSSKHNTRSLQYWKKRYSMYQRPKCEFMTPVSVSNGGAHVQSLYVCDKLTISFPLHDACINEYSNKLYLPSHKSLTF